MVGGLIMAHGDDGGLRLPPAVAPVQVVLMAVTADGGAAAALDGVGAGLEAAGVRIHRDARVDLSYGRRVVDWELKGVPVRVVVGPRELAAGQCSVTRRDTGAAEKVPLGEAVARCQALLAAIQRDMLVAATAERDARVVDAATVPEALSAAETGLARIPWSAVGEAGETELNAHGATVRCLQAADGSVPASEDEAGVVALVARAY
jgi:prolyl-tRNA synthetase